MRSPQPALNSSFLGVSTPVDSSSDWPRQQPCAANNDDRAFSSSRQGSSLGRSHRPQHGTETHILARYGPPQGHEHTGRELHRDVPYPDKKPTPFYPENYLSESLSLPGSSQTLVADGLSSIPVAQPSLSPGQLHHAVSYSQPSPSANSSYSSQEDALSVTMSDPTDRKDAVTNMSMLDIPEYTQEVVYGKSNHLMHDAKPQTYIQAIGSAGFSSQPSVWQPSPSVDPSTGYPSSETNSSTLSRGKGKGKRPRTASMTRPHRSLDPDLSPYGNRGPHTQDRSQNAGISKRRLSLSIGQVPIRPRPQPHGVADRGGVSMTTSGKPIPKKPRGKRTGPLGEGGRQLATRRRNERTVCIGCKMAKVIVSHESSERLGAISDPWLLLIFLHTHPLNPLAYSVIQCMTNVVYCQCEGREDGKDCLRCSSSSSSAPKPFVCVPASFFELVQQGSTVLLGKRHPVQEQNSSFY